MAGVGCGPHVLESFCLVIRRFLGSKTSRPVPEVWDVSEGASQHFPPTLLGSWEDGETGP